MEELSQNTNNKYPDSPYGRTLRFFDAVYPFDTEDIHYSDIFLSMNQCTSIDELFAVYHQLKDCCYKIRMRVSLNKLPIGVVKELEKGISFNDSIYSLINKDIENCYNENIFRLFKEKDNITPNICGEYYINLTSMYSPYKECIIREAKEKANIDVTELLDTINKRYFAFLEYWKEFKKFDWKMNGYQQAKQTVKDDYEYLKQFNWRQTSSDKSYYITIDDEEKKRRKEENELLRKKKEEEKRKTEEEEAERIKKTNSLSTVQIISIIIGAALFGLIFAAADAWAFALFGIFLLIMWGVK